MSRRVVITGCGVISPIGNDVKTFIENVKNGKCGIDNITAFDNTGYKTRVAAEVKDFNPKEFEISGSKKKDKFVQYALAAAYQANKNSGLVIDENNAHRVGVLVGSGIGGLLTIQEEYEKLLNGKKVSSHFIPKSIINMASGQISIQLGSKGVCSSVVTACASGTDSVGQGFRLIRDGYQDAMFVGGCESTINPLGIAGFESMAALSFSEDPNRASVPFDKERTGFVMGEGAAVLVLEEMESAVARGANIICEIAGYGQTSDSYHITAPDPEGEGAALAMKEAVIDAGIRLEKIGYINAHGTSTQLNDLTETVAIKKAFGEHSKKLAISSTKSMTGHMLGAAGAVEAIVCAYALEDEFLPQTINYRVPDEECDLDYITEGTRYEGVEYAISNSLGFGGHNGSLLFKAYRKED